MKCLNNRLRLGPSALWLVLLGGLLVMVGCGEGRPKRVPISGQVLIDGKPLPLGYLRLIPEGARPAGARIGPDGRFTLTTFEGSDGAVPGTHRATVRASEALSPTKVKWYAPKKYADAQTSGLTVDVDRPTDSLVIELTWDGGQPFIETIEPE